MAQKTRAQLKSDNSTNFADNTSGAITPALIRDFHVNLIDSIPNITDDQTSTIYTSKVTVSSAELLALYTTNKTLVAAPGTSKMIDVISIDAFYDYNSIAYATTTNVFVSYNGTGGELHTTGIDISGSLDTYQRVIFAQTSLASSFRVNTPLVLLANTANPTAGNGVLYVYLTYRIISL